MDLSRGTIIAGLYRAEKRIGVGGMGEVWACSRISDGRPVAIKVLLADNAEAGEVNARFRREAQVLSRVRSKYVAEVLDFLTDANGLVLVMELIPGDSFHVVLSNAGKLTIEQTLDTIEDVLRGLRDLHASNVVHRDLKPGNIVLRPCPGRRPRATLIDFGVSRIISPASDDDEEEVTAITRADRVLGTLEYMAPEQILGSRSVTGAADLYAVGSMMFRAIMGRHVFGGLQEGRLAMAKLNEEPPPLNTGRTDEVAVRTAALVARLIAKRMEHRYDTVEPVLEEVEAIRALIPANASDGPAIEVDEQPLQDLPDPNASSTDVPRVGSQVPTLPPKAANASQAAETSAPVRGARTSVTGVGFNASNRASTASSVPAPVPAQRSMLVPVLVAVMLFVVGSVAGSLLGFSYVRGGSVYQHVYPLVARSKTSHAGTVAGSLGAVSAGDMSSPSATLSDKGSSQPPPIDSAEVQPKGTDQPEPSQQPSEPATAQPDAQTPDATPDATANSTPDAMPDRTLGGDGATGDSPQQK